MQIILKCGLTFILSILIELTYKVKISNRWGNVTDYYMTPLHIEDIIFFMCLCLIIFLIMKRLKIQKWSLENSFDVSTRVLYWATLFFLLCWAPYYLSFFPGTGMQDEVYSMRWPFTTLNQPFFYNIILSCFYRTGRIIGNTDITIGILSFLEETFMAISLSYMIYWLNRKQCPKLFLIAITLSFALLPIFPNYAISLVKDKIFAIILLLLSLKLYDFIEMPQRRINDKKWSREFIALNSLMIISRSNGFFIFFPLIVILLLVYRIYWKRILMISLVVTLLGSTQTLAVRYIAQGKVPFKESVGIPIQQLGFVIAKNGKVPDKAADTLNQILPIEKWKELYRPWSPDPIKWNGEFNSNYLDSHKRAFLSAYFLTLPYNFKNYIQAYLFETYGFWSVLTWDSSQTIFSCAFSPEIINLPNPAGKVNDVYHLSERNLLPSNVKEFWGTVLRNYSIYLGAGTCAWILLFVMLICINNNEKKKLISLLPLFLCWLTLMISAPINFAFRYAFMFAVCMLLRPDYN